MESPGEIDIDYEFDLLHFLLLQFLRHKHPLVAHEHVDRAGLLDGALDVFEFPDVSAEDLDVTPSGELNGLLGILEADEVASEDADVGAIVGTEVR